MSKKWLWLGLAIPVAVGGFWMFNAGFSRGERTSLPATAAEVHDAASVTVTAEPVVIRDVPRSVDAVGTLYAYEEVVVSAKVEGRVRRIVHEVADRVSPGEPLLELDPTDYQLSKRQAERALQVELARLGLDDLPTAQFDFTKIPAVIQADVRLERAKNRLELTKNVAVASTREEIAERTLEFQVAQAEYDSQLRLAKASVKTAYMKQESLAITEQQLRDTVVAAPQPTKAVPGADQGGVYAISQRSVAEGTFVRPGVELFRLVIDQTLKLRVPIPERFSPEIRLGQDVNVVTGAYATPFAGVVSRINPTIDPATRTFECEIRIPNPKRELKPGGFAKASIITQVHSQATTVPLESVVTFAGIVKIFLIENGKSKEVQVTLGSQSTKWVEIATPPLPPGATVITTGQSALADGTPVMVRAGK